MQKNLIKLLLSVVILFTVSFSASSQIYVKVRPVVPVTVRPPQPSPAHVWIDEEWEPRGKDYRYAGGHWATPPHRGYHRTPGRWRHSNHGDVWIQGSWRRH
jgi:WXXGXW repeat (2 copies)